MVDFTSLTDLAALAVTIALGYLVAYARYQQFKKKFSLVANNLFLDLTGLAQTINDALADDVITSDEAKAIAAKALAVNGDVHAILHDP